VLASLTGSVTSFVGNHGVYAVFALMALDAVFPAASELVMVYAGALASGAFAGQHVVLFGSRERVVELDQESSVLGVASVRPVQHYARDAALVQFLVRQISLSGHC